MCTTRARPSSGLMCAEPFESRKASARLVDRLGRRTQTPGTTFGWPLGGRVAYCRVVRSTPRGLMDGAAEVRGLAAAVILCSGAQGHGRQVLAAQA